MGADPRSETPSTPLDAPGYVAPGWRSWLYADAGGLLTPLGLCALAAVALARWDVAARAYPVLDTAPLDAPAAEERRRGELVHAARALRALLDDARRDAAAEAPPDARWRARLDDVVREHRIHGDTRRPALARAETELRLVVLELAALHRRQNDLPGVEAAAMRLEATELLLHRATEDLAHAP
jgi:hypothetical protein